MSNFFCNFAAKLVICSIPTAKILQIFNISKFFNEKMLKKCNFIEKVLNLYRK